MERWRCRAYVYFASLGNVFLQRREQEFAFSERRHDEVYWARDIISDLQFSGFYRLCILLEVFFL